MLENMWSTLPYVIMWLMTYIIYITCWHHQLHHVRNLCHVMTSSHQVHHLGHIQKFSRATMGHPAVIRYDQSLILNPTVSCDCIVCSFSWTHNCVILSIRFSQTDVPVTVLRYCFVYSDWCSISNCHVNVLCVQTDVLCNCHVTVLFIQTDVPCDCSTIWMATALENCPVEFTLDNLPCNKDTWEEVQDFLQCPGIWDLLMLICVLCSSSYTEAEHRNYV